MPRKKIHRVEPYAFKIAETPDALEAWDLGTCIAVIIYDKKNKRAGLAYISDRAAYENVSKMLKELQKKGSSINELEAFIVYNSRPNYTKKKISKQNREKCREILEKANICPVLKHRKSDYPLDMIFETKNGKLSFATKT